MFLVWWLTEGEMWFREWREWRMDEKDDEKDDEGVN